jgi:hypothetical protein
MISIACIRNKTTFQPFLHQEVFPFLNIMLFKQNLPFSKTQQIILDVIDY